MLELALEVQRYSGRLMNARWQNEDDETPCDVRLHAALGLLLIARRWACALRVNGLDDSEAIEQIEAAVDECSLQYALRRF